jgi:hypothetical protein
VQTGGHGATWKRYVDPTPDVGLYHGTIFIPGATNGLIELRNAIGGQYTVGINGGTLASASPPLRSPSARVSR